ncbi:MAG TPA: ATP-binding protein [Pyrinomonadaceae bacterium]|nr:ATP-binding protein [Pyrinomonadaceae bacterium]
MRIAVSGAHCVGKSTLIDAFLSVHPEYAHEPEPYTVMVEDYGEEFSAEPCVEDFHRQLEFNIERLGRHAPGENVIYERCPIDFIAYMDVLDPNNIAPLLEPISRHLDLIIYLPIEQDDDDNAEYPKLRKAVDRRLSAILLDDDLAIVNIPVIEARGSTARRLEILETAIAT